MLGTGLWAAVALIGIWLLAAPIALAQTSPSDPPPTDPPTTAPPPTTIEKHVIDPGPPVTSPPTTPRPIVTPTAAPKPFVPFVAPSSNKTTTTTKPKNNKNSSSAATSATAAPAAQSTSPAADPGSPPGTDPPIRVGDVIATRDKQTAQERALAKKGVATGSSGSSNLPLIAAVAILPIIGAIALGGFGDTRRWFRRFANRNNYG